MSAVQRPDPYPPIGDYALIGDGRSWDQLRINHMPSHAAFQALVADPKRTEGEVHRKAGLLDTYSMLTLPHVNGLDPFAD